MAAAAIFGLAGAASAKTFVVTKRGDPAPNGCKQRDCSLREAVIAANARPGRDVIELPNRRRPYRLAQENTLGGEDGALEGDLDITNHPLIVRHPGKGRATIDANGIDRAFEIFAGATTRLKKLTLTGGAQPSSGGGDGGAVRTDAPLSVFRSVIRGNVADDDGGGVDADQGEPLVIARSAIVRNRGLTGDGGGVNGGGSDGFVLVRSSRVVRNQAGGEGGGLEAADASVEIVFSTFARNGAASDSGGGVNNDGAGATAIRRSTFDRNRAGTDGGGLFADGPPVSIVNSTFAGNRADGTGGAIHARDGASVSLNAVTVARNVADADGEGMIGINGGGLFRLSSVGFEVENSLVALNVVGASGSIRNDCAGDSKIDSLGHNLVSTLGPASACDGFGPPAPGDIVGVNPRIGKLKRNGGPT
ncbi:MAG TPA: hypothetical protein VK919_09265, partial [Solirubrobacterales bacterium]|nr:hypothetical protein [Solirubrobacterales bacterium]